MRTSTTSLTLAMTLLAALSLTACQPIEIRGATASPGSAGVAPPRWGAPRGAETVGRSRPSRRGGASEAPGVPWSSRPLLDEKIDPDSKYRLRPEQLGLTGEPALPAAPGGASGGASGGAARRASSSAGRTSLGYPLRSPKRPVDPERLAPAPAPPGPPPALRRRPKLERRRR